MKWGIAFARICWDNNILQFGTYCMSGSGPLALILLLLGWSNPCVAWQRGSHAMIWTVYRSVQMKELHIMALEKKYVSDSVSIVSLFIENKVLE